MSQDPSVKGIIRAEDSSITIRKRFYHLAQHSLVLSSFPLQHHWVFLQGPLP